jgi:hypothetical protein
MTALDLILTVFTFSFGFAGAFLFGAVLGLKRRVVALEEFVESLENSILR